jgi:peptidoglycan/LPS O-acetylase OafA/YrhL
MRTDEPTVARAIAYAGLVFVAIGGMTLILRGAAGWQTIVPSGMAIMLLVVGVMGLLFHAASDRDEQVRRLHWIFGLLWLTAGVVLPFIPVAGKIGVYFCTPVCLAVGLLFLLAFLRHENDAFYRDTTSRSSAASEHSWVACLVLLTLPDTSIWTSWPATSDPTS